MTSESATAAGPRPLELGYDPSDPSFVADPYPALARLRDEAPLILDRAPNLYLSFGAGIPYCLGAPLAKLEFDVLFERMLGRMPRLELLDVPVWKSRFVLRGLEALRVRT